MFPRDADQILCPRMSKVFILVMVPLAAMLCACSSPDRATTIGSANYATPSEPVSSSSPIKSGAIVYVALGDSTGVGQGARNGGYVDRMFRKLVVQRPGSHLVNLCVSGATTRDVLRGQLDRGVATNPDLVTLGIGINDIGHGMSVDEFGRNYQSILARLKRDTHAVVVVTNIPDISSGPRIPVSMRREYQQSIIDFNEKLKEIATAQNAIVFDIYSITREELHSHPEYFSADGFHPSDAGYEMWAEQMWPTLERVLGNN